MYQLTCSIVLFNNDVTVLKKTVESVLGSKLNLKLYFIDNSLTNKLANELTTIVASENIEYIFTGKNIGYGAGHNIAIRKTINESEYHLVLNPDVSFNKGVLEEIYSYMEQHKDVGQLIPKVLYPDKKIQYVCKLIPTPFNLVSRLLPSSVLKVYNEHFELRFSGYDAIMNVPYLSGSFMFLRCSAIKEVGLFDERFFMYPEDIDLTRRMHKKYKTIFYPYAEIIHEHTKSSFKSLRMFIIHAHNMIKYFNKWGWFFDNERTEINKAVLQQLKQTKE